MIERGLVQILAGAAGEFSSPELTFTCRLLFGVHSTTVLPQWHIKLKDPGHSAKSADGRLPLNMRMPLTQ